MLWMSFRARLPGPRPRKAFRLRWIEGFARKKEIAAAVGNDREDRSGPAITEYRRSSVHCFSDAWIQGTDSMSRGSS